jgi:type I restriction-modification system DNA methylase subunit
MASVDFGESAVEAALAKKLDLFARNIDQYLKPNYKEAQTRVEFVDALLIALGWDVGNSAGAAQRFKEVVVEPNQEVEGRKRAPDYVLRVGGTPVIFVEAKKPSVKIATDRAATRQARSYAWSAQLPIVVLTNFAEIAVFNGLVRPKPSDTSRTARLFYATYDELTDKWHEFSGLVSRDAVNSGELDRYVETLPSRGGAERIDQSFLRDLEVTRSDLAQHIYKQNPSLTDDQILSAVQLTIDRLVFLRIAEDRKVETYGSLLTVARASNPARALREAFREADARYNSGLFHFDKEVGRSEPDTLTPSLTLDNAVIKEIIERFYPPSPYAFSVMPIEILGRAYETFLAKRIVRKSDGTISLQLKPEVRKAGGVFYTPEWLSQRVVAQTLEPLLSSLTPDNINTSGVRTVRVVDPACGSGSFLVAAYKYLLDWYLQHYLQDVAKWSKTRPPRLEKNQSGDWCLSLTERKRILVQHIYGVDIDPQAVEVAKLSLLIVVLEDQSGPGLQEQLSVFKARVLPDLDSNIRCGNSLVGPNFISDEDLVSGVVPITAPFDWSKLGNGKFQAVVGNPPWLMAGYELPNEVLNYLMRHYSSYTGKADLYYLFLERTLSILANKGRVGMVVPNKMYATRAASGLRELLPGRVEAIVDFQTEKVFEKATNYTQVLYLTQVEDPARKVSYTRSLKRFTAQQSWQLDPAQLTRKRWDTNPPSSRKLWSKLEAAGRPLEEIVAGFGNGVQTGSDTLLILDRNDPAVKRIEESSLRPLLRGKDIRHGSLAESTKVVVFPYEVSGSKFVILTRKELAARPGLKRYLAAHKSDLDKRRWFGSSATELSGHWWGFMYLDAYATYANPHIVSPALSNRSHFALGDGRLTPTGTAGVTVLSLKAGYDPNPLLAILNSRLISAYILAHSTQYQGAYFKFSAPYLKPVPIIEANTREREVTYARLAKLWTSRASASAADRSRIDGRIDELVNDLYDVSADQVAEAETFIAPLGANDVAELDEVEELTSVSPDMPTPSRLPGQ